MSDQCRDSNSKDISCIIGFGVVNFGKVLVFPAYYGATLIINGARDIGETCQSVTQRIEEIGTGFGLLATYSGIVYILLKTSF